jgi:hypothetical protein
LNEAEFKVDGSINVVEDISRQSSIWTVAWLFLAAFSQAIVRIRSKKQSRKTWKICSPARKEAC